MSKPGVSLVLALALAASWAGAEERPAAERYWPQWRGPLLRGVAPHADPPLTWGEGRNVRWKVEVPGRGNASPVVWGDSVFVLTAVGTGEPPSEPPAADAAADGGGRGPRGVRPTEVLAFTVLAYDRRDGTLRWRRTARQELPHEGTHPDGSWASASPVTDGERLYAFFGSRGLYAYDLAGQLLWQQDLGDMETRLGFGEGSSPALAGDTLVVNWDHEGPSFLVALDARTGDVRWRVAREEQTSWATPLVVEAEGRRQVVVSATGKVRGYDLASGRELWSVGGMTANTIPSPVAADGTVYVTSGFRGNALKAIRLAAAHGELAGGEAILWEHDRDTPYVPSPLLYRGVLYFLKSNSGILSAFDAGRGTPRYGPFRLEGIDGVYASPVAAAGRIYVVGRNGTTVVLRHGEEPEVLATNRLDDRFDASPALVDREIYLRGHRSLYCLAEGETAEQQAKGLQDAPSE